MYEDAELEERVDNLEILLGQFIVQSNTSIARLSREMSAFKNEVRRDQKKMNKQWGDLANKMGTLVEDIIAPAVRPVAEKYFDCEILSLYVNARRKDKALDLKGAFDVIAASDRQVFLVETKSRPKIQHLSDFTENIEKFRKLFPEYRNHQLIPLFASLRFEGDIIAEATQKKIYLLAYREWEYMDILNFDGIFGDKPEAA